MRARPADALERAEASPLGAFWALDRRGVRDASPSGAVTDSKPLAGATVAVKDCFDVAGLPTTCGVARDWLPARSDSEAVRRLRAAGAVPLGKAAMDQLAWSTFALAPGFPACANPLDSALTPGGSSCGSAAAVAGGLATLGLGTDDAGSIRIPAACCGAVGLMPPGGWIPLTGAVAFAPSFDRGGVIGRSLNECVAAVEALAGRPVPASRAGTVRVGVLEDQIEQSDRAVAAAVDEAAQALTEWGAEIVPARLEGRSPPGMGKVLAAELERSWGDRVRAEPELYDDEVRGSIAFAERLSEEELARARNDLAEATAALEARLEGLDATLGPTMLWPAPPADGHPGVAEMTACTRAFNVLGWAALSLPHDSGLLVGIQLAAPPTGFGALLRLAAALSD